MVAKYLIIHMELHHFYIRGTINLRDRLHHDSISCDY